VTSVGAGAPEAIEADTVSESREGRVAQSRLRAERAAAAL
jgi:hypothetical protein